MAKIYVVESGVPNDPPPGCNCIRIEGEYQTLRQAEVEAAAFRDKYPELDAWVVEYDTNTDPKAW